MELITKTFAKQAIAFPDRVDKVLATVTTPEEAKGHLDKAATMQDYAKRLKAGVEIERPIALGVLKIKAKLGELLPARPPKERGAMGGRGKKAVAEDGIAFAPNTRTAYRKLAANKEQLEKYYKLVDDVPSQEGFLQWAKTKAVNAKKRAAQRSTADGESEIVTDFSDLPREHFCCIYADPPWPYGNQGTRASTGNHYATMSVDEIAAIPVAEAALPNAFLHLWTTNGFLFESRQVMESWGFEYRSCFVWVKPQIGMGNYWRVSHEFLLLGIRGKPAWHSRTLRSWDEFKRSKHSKKPSKVRCLIEEACDGPYLEMFGRRAVQGWTVFGNQVEADLFA